MTARDRTVEEALDVLGTVPHTVIGTLTGIHPDAKHADNCPGCMAQDALATVRDSLERLQSLWLAERELRLAEQAAHRQTNEEAEALAEELERLQEPRDETGYPAWSGLPNDPLVRFTSASWHCPVCDRRGDVHDERCLVLELVTVARRRKDGNRRLVETNGRLRETAEAAEARFTESEARCARLREERDMARTGRDQWERDAKGRGVVQYELLARAQAAETELATATTTAELAIRQLETAEARCARLQQALDHLLSDAQHHNLWWLENRIREALAAPDTLTAGEPGVGPDGTGRVATADGCAERQSTVDPSPAASEGPDTPADSTEPWFIPEGDRQCGVVHKNARATCMKRRGHDGSHATPQGTWIDGPWCEYPADSQPEETTT